MKILGIVLIVLYAALWLYLTMVHHIRYVQISMINRSAGTDVYRIDCRRRIIRKSTSEPWESKQYSKVEERHFSISQKNRFLNAVAFSGMPFWFAKYEPMEIRPGDEGNDYVICFAIGPLKKISCYGIGPKLEHILLGSFERNLMCLF